MHRYSAAFWVLLAVAGVTAGAFLVLSAPALAGHPGLTASFFLAGMIIQASPARVKSDITVSLEVVVQFVALAYAGLPAAVAVGLGAGLVTIRYARTDVLIKGIFNIAMFVDSVVVAGSVYWLFIDRPLFDIVVSDGLEGPLSLTLALLAASVAFSITNAFLLAAVLHFTNGVPVSNTVRELVRETIFLQFLYVGLAAIAYVLLAEIGFLTLVLMVVPLLVARRSLLSVQKRQEAFDRMVGAFVETIQAKDGYTRGHAERVSDLSVLVAERMGLSYEDRELIRYGAILHDVGKVGVSLGILCKAGPLTDDEFDEMKRHPDIGADILEDIDFLQPALAIVRHHHERMDGRGYPAGLASSEIPLLTRVVTAVDAFDAMTSTRSYRRALPVEVAIEELQDNAGTQFDAEVVGHLVAVIEQDGWTVTDEPVTTSAPIPAAQS